MMSSWLITGLDNLLISEKVKAISKGADIRSYYFDEINLSEMMAEVSTADLFSSGICYWLKEVGRLPATRKSVKSIGKLIGSLTGETKLIVSQQTHFGGDFLLRKRFLGSSFFKALVKLFDKHIDITIDLAQWTRERARKNYGLELSSEQVELLVSGSNDLPCLIDSELKKLALLKTKKQVQRIADTTFKWLVSSTSQDGLWVVRDLVMRKDTRALKALIQTYKQQSIGFALLRELYRSFSTLHLYLIATPEEKAHLLRGMSFRARKNLEAYKKLWDEKALLTAMLHITEAEFVHRTGRTAGMDPDQAERDLLVLLIKKLCSL